MNMSDEFENIWKEQVGIVWRFFPEFTLKV